MKVLNVLSLTIFCIVVASCGKTETKQTNEDQTESSGNEALYDEIMDIHDEVMPKTEELYNISKQLKANLLEAATDAEKQLLENQIQYFDSVNMMMMNWMHEFRLLPDSSSEETRREYYETHLEKVKLVREAILTAVDKGKN